MNRLAAAFGLTVACTIFVPATNVAGARTGSDSVSIVLSTADGKPLAVVAAPGGQTTVAAAMTNRGSVNRTVRVSVDGDDLSRQWATVANTIVEIAPGETSIVNARVVVPLEATAGSYELVIEAQVVDQSEAAASLPLGISVPGDPRAALQIAGVRLDPKTNSRLLIDVRNDGALSVAANAEVRIGESLEVKPTSVAVVVAPSATQQVAVTLAQPLKLPAKVSIELRYGPDTAHWSSTLRPPTEVRSRTIATTSASPEPTITEAARSAGIQPAVVLLALLVGAAVVWLIVELLASKRGPSADGRSVSSAGADGPNFMAVADALGAQLAPLVAAIEQLASAFVEREIPPIQMSEPAVPSNAAVVNVALIEESKVISNPDGYFADEVYATASLVEPVPLVERLDGMTATATGHDGVQALSDIESATLFVREAYLRPEIAVETREAIEAQLVADDAHHRAELIEAVASGLGIPKSILLEWMPDEVFDRTEIAATQVDVTAIQRENRVLELQVAILKRAVAHFARH